MRVIAIALVIFLSGCLGRHSGHNGYHFAWKDFHTNFLIDADKNEDGIVTRLERNEFTANWLVGKKLKKVDGFNQVYNMDGKKLSAEEFVSKWM